MKFVFSRDRFAHLEDHSAVRFKIEEVQGAKLTVGCYMVADPTLWDDEYGREMRGITWDETGTCVCLPFEKFFNLNENKHVQEKDLPWDYEYEVFEKRDGSLITPVLVNGQIFCKSKKSFYSDVALAANTLLASNTRLNLFCFDLLNRFYTPIFEFTSPDSEIVVNYGSEPKMVLLAIRDQKNGTYMDHNYMKLVAGSQGVEVINSYGKVPLDTLKDEMKTREDIEGYVIHFLNGVRVKMKTDWYLRLHHAKTDLRERDIASMFVDETIDDVKSVVVASGLSLEPIEKIEARVSRELEDIIDRTRELFGWIRLQESRKEAAIKFHGNAVFGLAMKLLDKKEPDYKMFWKKNYLQHYTLNTVYSNFKEEQ